MPDTTILTKLDQIESLPTLPIIAQKIQTLLASERSNMAQIASFISKDQAISARVVRLVNSAFFGLRNRVASIQQAIVLLGLNTVSNIVLGISVVKTFSNNPISSLFDREMFWFHAFGTAMGAKMFAIKLGRDEPEDYFLAGLLHDIGILVTEQFFHDEFVEIVKKVVEDKVDFTTSENAVLSCTHQEIGAFLATKWKLPDIITHSINYHHNPLLAPSNATERMKDICLLIHIADISSNNYGIHIGIPTGLKPLPENILTMIPLKEEQIAEVFENVSKEVRALAKEWGV